MMINDLNLNNFHTVGSSKAQRAVVGRQCWDPLTERITYHNSNINSNLQKPPGIADLTNYGLYRVAFRYFSLFLQMPIDVAEYAKFIPRKTRTHQYQFPNYKSLLASRKCGDSETKRMQFEMV